MTNSILAFAAPVQAESIPAWIWLLLVAAGIVATVTDVRHTRIPNWLTLPLLAAGLLYGFMHAGLPGLGDAALGAVAAGLVMVIGYIMFGGGAGDAKIMMAFGAWLGFDASIILMLAVTISGFVQALVVIISRGGLRDVPITIFHSLVTVRFATKQAMGGKFMGPAEAAESAEITSITTKRPRPRGWVPYAPAILVGTIVAWWYWTQYGALR
jgi:Flp pilus assembly protein protease CpaA